MLAPVQSGAAPATTFDLQPHLQGDLVELRPLVAEDWAALYAVASDPLIWEQHPAGDRWQQPVFRDFFQKALADGALIVIDRSTGRVIGSTRFHLHKPAAYGGPEVEIGWTFLARTHWGGRYNGEMKRLMLAHAFQFVGRVMFLVGPTNIRSQKAVERLGAVRCGEEETEDRLGRPVVHWKYVIRRTVRTSSLGRRTRGCS